MRHVQALTLTSKPVVRHGAFWCPGTEAYSRNCRVHVFSVPSFGCRCRVRLLSHARPRPGIPVVEKESCWAVVPASEIWCANAKGVHDSGGPQSATDGGHTVIRCAASSSKRIPDRSARPKTCPLLRTQGTCRDTLCCSCKQWE